jgi:hypothetical protein
MRNGFKKNHGCKTVVVFHFLSLMSFHLKAQLSEFVPQGFYQIEPNHQFHVPLFHLSGGKIHHHSSCIFLPAESAQDSIDFLFLRFCPENKDIELLPFILPGDEKIKRDKAYSIRNFHFDAEHIFINADRVYSFILNTGVFVSVGRGIDTEVLYKCSEYEIHNLYRDGHPLDVPVKSMIMRKNIPSRESKTILPPSHDVRLTRFRPSKLTAANEEYIVRASVSQPVLYLYNHDLTLLDSIRFMPDNQWKNITDVFDKKELKVMRRKKTGMFDFVMEAFNRGIYKSQNVLFTGDRQFFLSAYQSYPNQSVFIFSITSDEKLDLILSSSVCEIGEKSPSQSGYCPQELFSKGIYLKGHLYLWQLGDEVPPWDKPNAIVNTPGEACPVIPTGIQLLEFKLKE